MNAFLTFLGVTWIENTSSHFIYHEQCQLILKTRKYVYKV